MDDANDEAGMRAIPILRIFSIEKALEFYVGFLGFTVDWRHSLPGGGPTYLQVSRDGMAIHLSEHHGDCTPGSTVFVRTSRIEALHSELIAANYPYNRPRLDPAPWGGRVMEATDPFGNRLRFCGD